MNLRKFLSPEENNLLDDAVEETYARATSTGERVDAFLEILRDAEQAHAQGVGFIFQHCLETGAASLLKARYKARTQVLVSYEGALLSRPSSIGTTRTNGEGDSYVTQALIHTMTRQELIDKRQAYLAQMKAYGINVATIDKLLALLDACPGALTPADAAEGLGTTVEAWLAGDSLAA